MSSIGFGAQYSRLDYGQSDAVDSDGESLGTFESYEWNLLLGAGVDVLRLLDLTGPKSPVAWGLGTSFKYARVDLAPDNLIPDVLGSGSGEGDSWDFDIGTLVTARMPLGGVGQTDGASYLGARLGVQLSGVVGNEIEFSNGQSDPMPQNLRVGIALEGVGETSSGNQVARAIISYEREESRIAPSLPGINRYGLEITVGLEFERMGWLISPRFGYIDDEDASVENYTAGGGVGSRIPFGTTTLGVRFDYANTPQASGLDRVHSFTLSGAIGF